MLKCKGRKTPTISSRGARTKCNAGQSELQQVFNLKVITKTSFYYHCTGQKVWKQMVVMLLAQQLYIIILTIVQDRSLDNEQT